MLLFFCNKSLKYQKNRLLSRKIKYIPNYTNCDFSETEEHTYIDGECVCGAVEATGPVVDSALSVYRVSLAFGNESLEMKFRISTQNVLNLSKYSDIELVLIPQKYDNNYNLIKEPVEIVIPKAELDNVGNGSRYKEYTYSDIFLYELDLGIQYMLRGKDSSGKVIGVSEVLTTSPVAYMKEIITSSTTTAASKTAYTDALIVGDEFMKVTGADYPGSDLSEATSIIADFDISAASPNVPENYNTVDEFTSYDSAYGTASGLAHRIRTSVETTKVPFINFRIYDKNKELDWNKLYVIVTFTSKSSSGEEDKTYVYNGESDFSWAGTFINTKFDQVGIHDSDKDITFTVKYGDVTLDDNLTDEEIADALESANVSTKCQYVYSIETYEGANKDTGNAAAAMTALLKLGASFRAFMGL